MRSSESPALVSRNPSVMGPLARQSWPAINRRGQDGITSFGTGVHEPWSGYFTKELLLVGELNG